MADDDVATTDEKPVVVADAGTAEPSPGASGRLDLPKSSSRSGPSVQELFGIPGDVISGLGDIKRSEIDQKERIMRASESQAAADRSLAMSHYRAAGLEAERMQPWNSTEEYRKVATNPLESFGSFASVFAIVASAFTHAPLENALNGSAAAMNAIKKGDDEAYERGFTAWKANMDLFQKRFNMQNTLYNDALTLMDKDTQQGRIALQNAAVRFGDKKALFLLENGYDKELIDLQTSRVRQFQAMTEAKDRIDESTFKNQAYEGMLGDFEARMDRKATPIEQVDLWKQAHGVKEDWKDKLMNRYFLEHQGEPNFVENAAKYAQTLYAVGRGGNTELMRHLEEVRAEHERNHPGEPFTEAMRLEAVERFNAAKNAGKGSQYSQWLAGFRKEYAAAHDDQQPTQAQIDAAWGDRQRKLEKDPERLAFNTWFSKYMLDHADQDDPRPSEAEQTAKRAEIKEAVRAKGQKEKAITEIQAQNPGMTLVQATKKYNLESNVRGFSTADQKYLPAVPIAMRHLQALDALTSLTAKQVNDPTGWARHLPQHLMAEYGGFNKPQQAWTFALEGARAEMTQLGAGGARLKADALAALNRLPNNFADSGVNRGRIQELQRDVVNDARARISLLESGGRYPLENEYVRQQYNSLGIYSTKAEGSDPLLTLRRNPEELGIDQLQILSRNDATLTPDEQKKLRAEVARRKQLRQNQPVE